VGVAEAGRKEGQDDSDVNQVGHSNIATMTPCPGPQLIKNQTIRIKTVLTHWHF
jgi:hypothetical protein